MFPHKATHLMECNWGKDADQFRPERFEDSELTLLGRFNSFSGGPRNCLGEVCYAQTSDGVIFSVSLSLSSLSFPSCFSNPQGSPITPSSTPLSSSALP